MQWNVQNSFSLWIDTDCAINLLRDPRSCPNTHIMNNTEGNVHFKKKLKVEGWYKSELGQSALQAIHIMDVIPTDDVSVVQHLVIVLDSSKVPGLVPGLEGAFLCGVCIFSLC